jgi:hypothetical protein
MLKLISSIGIFLALQVSSYAQTTPNQVAAEGVGSSGGGRALVCRDLSGTITKAQMLDITEGLTASPIGYNFVISESVDASDSEVIKEKRVTQRINDALTKLNGLNTLKSTFNQSITDVRNGKVIEKADEDLVPPEDLGAVHLLSRQKGCNFEAVGVYALDGKLHVNPEIYSALDSSNQAAFYIHEGVYKYFRTLRATEWYSLFGHDYSRTIQTETNSENARYVTSDLMSSDLKVSLKAAKYGLENFHSEVFGTPSLNFEKRRISRRWSFSSDQDLISASFLPSNVERYLDRQLEKRTLSLVFHGGLALGAFGTDYRASYLCDAFKHECVIYKWAYKDDFRNPLNSLDAPVSKLRYDSANNTLYGTLTETGVEFIVGNPNW